MPGRTDPDYLLGVQYKDASNLIARIRLHKQFSTNPDDWPLWVFDQLQIPPGGYALEVGCGSGTLWTENLHRIADDWRIMLSDFSLGMVREVRRHPHLSDKGFVFGVVDVQSMPFVAGTFDVLIANHMLYHVPDRRKALTEIRRVLKRGGRLYAATNGRRHMVELGALLQRFDAQYPVNDDRYVEAFGLENGREQLSVFFPRVTLHCYEDALVVTEAEPLAAYVLSQKRSWVVEERREELVRFLDREIVLRGAIHIQKETGLFEAWKDNDV